MVHLPIGILYVSFVMAWVARRESYAGLRPAVSFTLLIGAVSTVLASVLGLLLASYGGYDASTLGFHQWFGIAVAVLRMAVWGLYRHGGDQRAGMRRLVKARPSPFPPFIVLSSLPGPSARTLTHAPPP